MEAISYQGLFHLSAGALAFVTMIAGLREWGLRRSLAAGISEDRSNLEWHGVDSLTVVDIIEETHDIKTFRLIRSEGRSFPTFQEGQFLTFQIPHGEGAVQRSYSISSSSLNNKVLSVSIKKISEGIGSSWFHGLSIGDTVKAYNPNGLFILGEEKYNSKTPQVLVAGGIGITPFISMIQGVLDIGSTTPLYLFYGCRTEDDMAFDLELKSLAKRYKNFHYTPVLSDAQGAWTGEKGFIGIHLIEKQIGDLNSAKYYFCGPPVMTDSLTEALL
ncbi:MAG: hypothetical protein KDD61_02110, partial [Bdellovibrionales bacterium]|nr:hypothetical protein [Bdellovibrionales bacterium]